MSPSTCKARAKVSAGDQLSLFAGEEYARVVKPRWPCPACGGNPLPDPTLNDAGYDDPLDGADPCLGWLRNVLFACCGHGGRDHAYVTLVTTGEKTILRDEDALRYFRSLGVGPPAEETPA